jgi:hypothetical protein
VTKLRPMRRSTPEYVITMDGATVTIRPKRVRRPEAEISLSWDMIYRRALLLRAPKKKRRVSRNLLTLP